MNPGYLSEREKSILADLMDLRHQEATTSDIQPIESDLITRARDRVRKIKNNVKACNYTVEQVEERESIIMALDDISWYRSEKIISHAKYSDVLAVPVGKLLPHESKLLQDVRTAVTVYQEACK